MGDQVKMTCIALQDPKCINLTIFKGHTLPKLSDDRISKNTHFIVVWNKLVPMSSKLLFWADLFILSSWKIFIEKSPSQKLKICHHYVFQRNFRALSEIFQNHSSLKFEIWATYILIKLTKPTKKYANNFQLVKYSF